MKAKKFLLFLLATALLLGGCGSGKKNGDLRALVLFAEDAKSPRQKEVLTALENAGYAAEQACAEGDHEVQKTQLADLQAYNLVVVEPVDVSLAGELVELIGETPCVFIGEEPDAEVLDSAEKLYYVGGDQTDEGFLQGITLQSSLDRGDINGDDVIAFAILRGPRDDERAKMLTQHCDEALRAGKLACKLEDVRLTDWTEADARKQTLAMLKQRGKDVEVLLCNSDTLALGAIRGVKDGGWTPGQDIYIVGIGDSKEILEAISEGECLGTVIPNKSNRAELVAKAAKALRDGTATEKRLYGGYQIVTRETVSIYLGR
jgi:methyl-galactoside transport system substrate-binding protein